MKRIGIIDLTNILYVTHFSVLKKYKDFSPEFLFLGVLNSINFFNLKYKLDSVLIACDGQSSSWRKDIFPQYKGNRKKETIDYYDEMNEVLGKMIDFLSEHSSLPTVIIDKAEADDVIAVMTHRYKPNNKVFIYSSDKDFIQLLDDDVVLYSPTQQVERKPEESIEFDLFLKCIRGDSGDNIPSAYPKVRKTKLMEAHNDSFMMSNLMETVLDDGKKVSEKYELNRQLIDFKHIPANIIKDIDMFIDNVVGSKTASGEFKLLKFLRNNELKGLSSHLGKFKGLLKKSLDP